MTPPRVTVAEALLVGPARPLPVPATTASRQILTTPGRLLGWSLAESTGSAAAVVRLWSGPSASGQLAGRINLASNGMSAHWTDMLGVLCVGGIYLEVVSGSVEGAIYVRAEW